tara:strand:+ start:91 stop:672 length:582 start_codon:yes stop_codon:yes gene_type:complete
MIDNKENGMMTKIWGPPGWIFLHSVTFGFPQEVTCKNQHRVLQYINFFNSVGNVLPCKYCRDSYNEYLREHPVEQHCTSRKTLTRWLYDIHNKVNSKLGVAPCDIPRFSQVEKKYESYRAACKQTTDQDRSNSLIKGCTIPQTGIKKKCKILVVSDDDKAGKFDNYYSILAGLCLVVGVVIIWLILVVLNNLK